ncbi:MAG: O-antigen ligase family protein, partial [Acidobacteria bacterium]|nr:O-antigen ligase family protein [Acidobacteriota bacterium]
RPGTTTRTGMPALVFGAVCLASAAATYPIRLLQVLPDLPARQALFDALADYFVGSPLSDPLFFAMLAAQGVALAWAAESTCRRVAGLTAWVVSAALLSHALSALLNLQRIVSAASRREDFPASILELFRTVRVSTQYDVNAAASVFVMVGVASIGLWTWRKSLWQIPATGLVMVGLWLTGSRVAMLAAAVSGLLALVAGAVGASGRARWLGFASAGAVVVAAAAAAVVYPQGRNLNVSASVESRTVLFRTGVQMVKDSPVFGIGIGRFHELSEQYGSSDISRILGVRRTRDNAHNNYLQVAAESGIVGLAAFGWMLGACVAGGIRRLRLLDAHRRWQLAGVVGMMLTWLAGHPLLVPEAAVMFWLFAGVAATVGPAPPPRPAKRVSGAIVLVVILASIPWQASGQRRRAELEHFGRGLSAWQVPDIGERYRNTGRQFSLFLPAGQLVTLPIRTAPGVASPLTLRLFAAGKEVDAVIAGPDDWVMYVFRVPDGPDRFVEVRFIVESPDGTPADCAPCLHVGKQSVRTAPPV